MDDLTFRLADYAASLRFDDLPAEVVQAATQRVVDTIGCAIGGHDCAQAVIGRRLAQGGAPERYPGRLLGTNERSSAEIASFVNTLMIRNLDFNDSHPGVHPSDCLGALLALAEAAQADGRRFLTAMVVAYEIVTQLSDAARLRERGWDQGLAVGVGTAAAVGSLLNLPREQIVHGISITATANVPLRATRAGELSLWKGAATAYAVRNGVFGMLLASEGMTGPDRPFEGRHGLWEQITGPFQLAQLGARGGEFLTPRVRLKYWPVEYNAQAGVWAAREVRSRFALEEVARIAIWTYWSGWHEIGSEPEKWDPRTRETADHSLPYIFARTLVHGSIGLEAFEPAAYLDPSLRPLMQKITVATDDSIEAAWPADVVMRVDVTTTGGDKQTIEIVNPLGHEKRPMQDADISAKFERLTRPIYGEPRTQQLLNQWWSVSSLPNLSEPINLLSRQ
jgi:2-methylcitrate dehydratase